MGPAGSINRNSPWINSILRGPSLSKAPESTIVSKSAPVSGVVVVDMGSRSMDLEQLFRVQFGSGVAAGRDLGWWGDDFDAAITSVFAVVHHVDAAVGNIDDPVFRDAGLGVDVGFFA